MRLMISELQRQLAELDNTSTSSKSSDEQAPQIPPRLRSNPFDKKNSEYLKRKKFKKFLIYLTYFRH
jgi:hypothetical protein